MPWPRPIKTRQGNQLVAGFQFVPGLVAKTGTPTEPETGQTSPIGPPINNSGGDWWGAAWWYANWWAQDWFAAHGTVIPVLPGTLGYWWRSHWWVDYWFCDNWFSPGFGVLAGTNFPPSAPSGLTAGTLSTTSIGLNWMEVNHTTTPVTGFIIERSLDGISYLPIATVGSTTFTYIDTGLTPATTYYYHIIATSGVGNSVASAPASATTSTIPPPPVCSPPPSWSIHFEDHFDGPDTNNQFSFGLGGTNWGYAIPFGTGDFTGRRPNTGSVGAWQVQSHAAKSLTLGVVTTQCSANAVSGLSVTQCHTQCKVTLDPGTPASWAGVFARATSSPSKRAYVVYLKADGSVAITLFQHPVGHYFIDSAVTVIASAPAGTVPSVANALLDVTFL
jgi:hypothetical protein